MKRVLSVLLTLTLCAVLLIPMGMTALADGTETQYKITSMTVADIQTTLNGVATVSESGGVVTITLTDDVFGQLYFDCLNGSYVLNANGHTITSEDTDTPVFLNNEQNMTVRLTGNGTYVPTQTPPWGWAVFNGLTNTLIIESGTFYKGAEDTIFTTSNESNTLKFQRQAGYDYYTVEHNDPYMSVPKYCFEDYVRHHNVGSGTLVVQQRNFETDFTTFADAGYYSDEYNGADKSGAIAFNSFFKEYAGYPEVVEYYGLYVYQTGHEADKVTAQSADKTVLAENLGKFHVLIENIAEENFGKTVVAVPFIIINSEVKMGTACTYSVNQGGKWLGPVGGAE